MSEKLKQKLEDVQKRFENFSNFIELPDFRSFLLFTLTSQVPTNILAQIGLGGSKDVINLPYNPISKVYYQKINLMSAGSLILYVKNNPISDEFTLGKDDPIIKSFLNPNEISLAFRGKEKFLLPMISDCSTFNNDEKTSLTVKVDDNDNLVVVACGNWSGRPEWVGCWTSDDMGSTWTEIYASYQRETGVITTTST